MTDTGDCIRIITWYHHVEQPQVVPQYRDTSSHTEEAEAAQTPASNRTRTIQESVPRNCQDLWMCAMRRWCCEWR